MNLVERAKEFAHEAHDRVNQKRKYSGEPYWVHTDQVAALVMQALPNDEEAIAAAHLHDVLEDVTPKYPAYSAGQIRALFGERVLRLVQDLTDVYTKEAFPKLNRAARKELERERISKTDAVVKTIKLADFISNTASIVKDDKDFATVYLREKLALLPYLSEGNKELLQQATVQTISACAACGIDIPVLNA